MIERPTVAVTRAEPDAWPLARALESVGLRAVITPLLHVEMRPPRGLADAVLSSPPFDWVACTSAHAVEALVAAAPAGGVVRDRLMGARLGAVGERTAEALGAHGWPAALTPEVTDAAHLARAMLAADRAPRRRVLFPRALAARAELPAILGDAGWDVTEVPCYETCAAPAGGTKLVVHLAAGDVQAVVLASGSAARSFAQLVPAALWPAARLVTIGPTTTSAARDAGLVVSAEAATPSLEALAEAVRRLLLASQVHA